MGGWDFTFCLNRYKVSLLVAQQASDQRNFARIGFCSHPFELIVRLGMRGYPHIPRRDDPPFMRDIPARRADQHDAHEQRTQPELEPAAFARGGHGDIVAGARIQRQFA